MTSETKLFVGIIVGTVVIIAAGILLLSKSSSTPSVNPSLLVRSDSHKIASGSGVITMVEFGDYECPACGAYFPVVQQIINDFKDKMIYVFRNFPLDTIHPNAHPAALAAEAAGKQGKFWEMHDLLYEKQNEWGTANNASDLFVGYAKGLGINVDQFKRDMASPDVANIVQADINDGNALGISATPTFFVNGVQIENPASLADFETLIKDAIAKVPTPTPGKTQAYHAHFNFKVYVGGSAIDFSQSKYQSNNGKDLNEYMHLHDGVGDVVHVHKQGVTIGTFFDSLGMKLANNSFTDDAGHSYTVKMYVNGKENTEYANYVPQDLDQILITDGPIVSVADTACIYSLKCPQRGTPPTENCVGGLGTGCKE